MLTAITDENTEISDWFEFGRKYPKLTTIAVKITTIVAI
jgi:general stress protein 26